MADIPLTGVQIFFPITTSVSNDKLVFEQDNGGFKYIQKNAVSDRNETIDIAVKVRQSEFQTFYTFIRSNMGDTVYLNKSGIQPFITSSTNNAVKIVDYTEPVRQQKYYTMTLKLLKAL